MTSVQQGLLERNRTPVAEPGQVEDAQRLQADCAEDHRRHLVDGSYEPTRQRPVTSLSVEEDTADDALTRVQLALIEVVGYRKIGV